MLEICGDIGTSWHDLGIMLKLPPAILVNIDADRRLCREKAREMLYEWMKREGSSATVGSLADSLERIGNRRVAQKLLGMYFVIHVYLKTFMTVPLFCNLGPGCSSNLIISNTRVCVSLGYPNTEKRVENTTRSGVFLTNSGCLDSQ